MTLAPTTSFADVSAPPLPHAAPAPCVSAQNLAKSIDDRSILHNLTFDIPHGQFLALLGPNGAGKSTLLKIFSTLLAPSGGSLSLFNLNPRTQSAAIRAQIGLVSHQSMLYADLSPLENLTFFAKLYNVPNPSQRAAHLLSILGLNDRAHDPLKSFSRGMTQRVSIARALIHDPALLLADEPFAGLDAPSAATLERILVSLHAAGKTIILTNHDIPQSLRLAQRAIVLSKGRIVTDAPANSLDPHHLLFRMQRDAA